MLRVGLTGGLASGKTFVGRTLQELGCLLIRSDELGHQVLEPQGEAYSDTVRAFGPQIQTADGLIDRRILASIVFKDPEKLALLNSIVHGPVRARTHKLLDSYERTHPHGIAVVEAAILIETGSWRDYQKLLLAICSPEQQVTRAMERDLISREEALERMSRQMPLEEKLKYADYIIDTSGSKENTAAQVRAVHESLTGLI